jgi:hypothetical protein
LDDSINEKFDYSFSVEQAKELCYFIRKNNVKFSNNLDNFYLEIQNFVYNSMTIDEAEIFFNEN